jgi:hypothetical protein
MSYTIVVNTREIRLGFWFFERLMVFEEKMFGISIGRKLHENKSRDSSVHHIVCFDDIRMF